MSDFNFFSEFKKPTDQEWKNVLEKELKGKSYEDVLVKNLEIEDLNFDAAMSQNNIETKVVFNTNGKSNVWVNEAFVLVNDVKESNTKALHFLMSGATGLRFVFSEMLLDLDALFANIGFEYIHVSIDCQNENQLKAIEAYFQGKKANISYVNDSFLSGYNALNNVGVRADVLQQAGANATQELCYALLSGHTLLKQMISEGKSIAEINARIDFNFGIGSNYLVEISKLRAFQALWQFLLTQYDPSFAGKANVSAQTTFVNKSLKDPHTNMLRQTTEAMSAVLGGVDRLCVVPYDQYSSDESTAFTQRMALNISNILAEESYLDSVTDPAVGSYSIEFIMQALIDKTWTFFQKWNMKSFEEANGQLQIDVKATADLRRKRFQENQDQFIGMNVYTNPKALENYWVMEPRNIFPALILEETQTISN